MEYKTEKMMFKYITTKENRMNILKYIIGGAVWFFSSMGFMYCIALIYVWIWQAL